MQKWNLITSLGFLSAIVLIVTIIVVFFFVNPLSFLKKDSSEKISSTCLQNFATKFAPEQIGEFTKVKELQPYISDDHKTYQSEYSGNEGILAVGVTIGGDMPRNTHKLLISPEEERQKYLNDFRATVTKRQGAPAAEKLKMRWVTISEVPVQIHSIEDEQLAVALESAPMGILLSPNSNLAILLNFEKIQQNPEAVASEYLNKVCA